MQGTELRLLSRRRHEGALRRGSYATPGRMKMQFGMPTLIENRTLQDNIDLCKSLGLQFIELNMNFPEYQVDKLEQIEN